MVRRQWLSSLSTPVADRSLFIGARKTMNVFEVLYELIPAIEHAVVLILVATSSDVANPKFSADVKRRLMSIPVKSPTKGFLAKLARKPANPSGAAAKPAVLR
jgi:hypothetical protein